MLNQNVKMFTVKIMIICLTFLGLIGLSFAEVKNDVEPLVAFSFNKPAVFQTPQGWTADNMTGYLTNPEDILNFCKKSFPELDIRNYVEADAAVDIEAFCEGCNQRALVRPFRCMVGPFTVVSPIVPDNCLTDQTIRPTECQTWTAWQSVAAAACAMHGMETSWFSILQPCDIGKFSGVQYVCCPSSGVSIEVINSFPAQVSEYNSTPSPAETRKDDAEDDVYVDSGNKPESEHSRYVQARAELQRKQNDEIAKIMDAWDEAQKEVDKMRAKDSDMAEKLEKKITARFQKTIDSLEEKEQAEKRQMDSVHDQKVQVELNEKKREAVEAYMAIISNKQATLKDILKALKHYVRVEEKDRMHAINHYQHLKQTDHTTAESSRALVAEHLRTIALRVNRAVEMLNRVPEYKEEIQEKIKDMLEEYQGFDSLESSIVGDVVKDAKDGDQSQEEEEEEDEEGEGTAEDADMSKKEEGHGNLGVEGDLGVLKSGKDVGKAVQAGDKGVVQQKEQLGARTVSKTEDGEDEDDDEGVVRLQPAAHPNHMGASELRLEERSSLVHKQSSASSLGALAFIIAGSIFLLAVTILGLFLWRRQAAVTRRRIKTADASLLLASQEQVHIASMQVTGYENPTYKYFEAKAVI